MLRLCAICIDSISLASLSVQRLIGFRPPRIRTLGWIGREVEAATELEAANQEQNQNEKRLRLMIRSDCIRRALLSDLIRVELGWMELKSRIKSAHPFKREINSDRIDSKAQRNESDRIKGEQNWEIERVCELDKLHNSSVNNNQNNNNNKLNSTPTPDRSHTDLFQLDDRKTN